MEYETPYQARNVAKYAAFENSPGTLSFEFVGFMIEYGMDQVLD
jgi:hypothetical protein